MLDTFLQPSAITRLLHLLQAAQPYLTPSWGRLADLCVRFLSICDLFSNPYTTDFPRIFRDIRGCTPSNDMNALLCAIRPFCSEEELQMLQMYEQFKQMQKAMDMWKMVSDLMPDGAGNGFDNMFSDFMNVRTATSEAKDTTDSSVSDTDPLLAFLTPEQLSLYNSILSDESKAQSDKPKPNV